MIGRRGGATMAETASLNIALPSEHHHKDTEAEEERPFLGLSKLIPKFVSGTKC